MLGRSCLLLSFILVESGCGGGGGGLPVVSPSFVHVGTVANVIGDRTEIDHPLLNGNPAKIVIVTAVANPGGGFPRLYPSGQLATQYDAGTGRWSIRNLGGSGLVDYAFNVSCWDRGPNAFLHTTSLANRPTGLLHVSRLSRADLDGMPDARLLVTMHIDPSVASTAVANAHHVGAYYHAPDSAWTVFNQDSADLVPNVGFHVVVLPAGLGDWIHVAGAGTINPSDDSHSRLDHPDANGAPNAILQLTAVWNPGGIGGIYYDHIHTLVYEDSESRWYVSTEAGLANPMPVDASFFVARDAR